jgi:hypothetical protein
MDLNISSLEDVNLLVNTTATNVTTGGNFKHNKLASWLDINRRFEIREVL